MHFISRLSFHFVPHFIYFFCPATFFKLKRSNFKYFRFSWYFQKRLKMWRTLVGSFIFFCLYLAQNSLLQPTTLYLTPSFSPHLSLTIYAFSPNSPSLYLHMLKCVYIITRCLEMHEMVPERCWSLNTPTNFQKPPPYTHAQRYTHTQSSCVGSHHMKFYFLQTTITCNAYLDHLVL